MTRLRFRVSGDMVFPFLSQSRFRVKAHAFPSVAATGRRTGLPPRLADARVRDLRARKTTRNIRDTARAGPRRFPVQRVILVADRSLLGPENIGELTAPADRGGRRLEFILAVPTRRHADPVPTFGALDFGEDGLAEAIFADHRPIVAHDHVRAAE